MHMHASMRMHDPMADPMAALADMVYPLRDLESAGFLECLPDAMPVSKVSTFSYSPLLHASCVGSMVASYVLGLADRHGDNMLLLRGRVFAHIDFGYVAGHRPWPFDTGPFPIPMRFKEACGEQQWEGFLEDVSVAYSILQARREELCIVAQSLASPLVGPLTSPSPGALPASDSVDFATFLHKTLDKSAAEVRQLAADGPTCWETRVKEATYTAGMMAGKTLRDAGVPV